MAKRVFSLHDVDADEAAGVEAALDAEGIAWYRTEANPWGFSTAALWVSDDADQVRARAAIDRYQQERRQRRELLAPPQDSLGSRLRQAPLQVLSRLTIALAILLLMLLPFLDWALTG